VRVATTKRDNAPNNRPRKERTRNFQKIANVSQPVVDRHLVDNNISQSSTHARYRNENATTSENPDDLVLGNHETSTGIQEISIISTLQTGYPAYMLHVKTMSGACIHAPPCAMRYRCDIPPLSKGGQS
jgi:hypothetical protein